MMKLHRRSDDAQLPLRAVQAWENSLAKLEQNAREPPATFTANRADAQYATQRLVDQATRVAPPKPDLLLKGLLLPRREAGALPSMPMRAMAIDAALSTVEHRRVALVLAQAYFDGNAGAPGDSPWLDAAYLDRFFAGNFRAVEPPPTSLEAFRHLLRGYRPPGPSTANLLACAEAYDTVLAQRRRAPNESEVQLDEDERNLAEECLRLANNNWQGLHGQARPPSCLPGVRLLLRGVGELACNPGEVGALLAVVSLCEEDWRYLREQPTLERQRQRRAKALERREAGLLQLAEMVSAITEHSRAGSYETAQETVAAAYDEVERGRYGDRGVALLRGLLGHYLARANEQALQACWRTDVARARRLLAQAIGLCEPRQLALPPQALARRLAPPVEAPVPRSPGLASLRPKRPPPLTPALLGGHTPPPSAPHPLRSPPPTAPPRGPLPTPPPAPRPWSPADAAVVSVTGAYLEDYFREVEQATQRPPANAAPVQVSPSVVASSEADFELGLPPRPGAAPAAPIPSAGGAHEVAPKDPPGRRLSRTSSRTSLHTLRQRPPPSTPPPLPNTEPLQLGRERRASQGEPARGARRSQVATPHRLLFEAMPPPKEPQRIDEELIRTLFSDADATTDPTRSAQSTSLLLALEGRTRAKAACIALFQQLEAGHLDNAAEALPEVQNAVSGLDSMEALRQRLAEPTRYERVLTELGRHGERALAPTALRERIATGLQANGNVRGLENALRDSFARLDGEATRQLLALLLASTPPQPAAAAWTADTSPLLEAIRVWEPDWHLRAAATQLVRHIDGHRGAKRWRGAFILLGRYLVLQGPAGSLLCDGHDPQDPAGKLTWELGESDVYPRASDQLVAALNGDNGLRGESLVVSLHSRGELQRVRFHMQWADAEGVVDWLDAMEALLDAAANGEAPEPLLDRLEAAARGDSLDAELKLFERSPTPLPS